MFVGTMSIQRTHAKQCKDSLLLHTHPSMYNVYKSQSPNSFSPAAFYHKTYECTIPNTSSPSTWSHLRALRDTGNTCHGSPDLGEGSSRDHTCTTCPWNAKRRRQDYGCTCMCGDSRGCLTLSGVKTHHQSDTQGAW